MKTESSSLFLILLFEEVTSPSVLANRCCLVLTQSLRWVRNTFYKAVMFDKQFLTKTRTLLLEERGGIWWLYFVYSMSEMTTPTLDQLLPLNQPRVIGITGIFRNEQKTKVRKPQEWLVTATLLNWSDESSQKQTIARQFRKQSTRL